MIKQFFLFFSFLITFSSVSQVITVNQENSYELFAETLTNPKDLRYQEILSKYDAYIKNHPEDIIIKLYRCKFIGSAYYDEYEDYDTNYEETDACINALFEEHSNHPDVVLYKLQNTYGEDREQLLTDIIKTYNEDKSKWTYNQISKIYKIGAEYYTEDNDFKAVMYAEKAERFSDSLDLSVLLTKAHLRLGNKVKAKENLIESLYRDDIAWVLKQKGELLIEFEEYDKALEMFNRVEAKDSTFSNTQSLYKIFVENKTYDQARQFLIKDTIAEWNKIEALQKLLKHDLSYSSGDIAYQSYRRVQKESFYDDFFGIKRIQLFFKSPLSSLTLTDVSHFLILALFIIVILMIPYLWVLPVYAVNKLFKIRLPDGYIKIPIDWSLKHFWLISVVYFVSQIIVVFVFYYQDNINYYFDIVNSYFEETLIESEIVLANSMILFSALLFSFTLLFLNKKRLKFVFNSNIGFLKIIGLSIGFLIFNAIINKTIGSFVDIDNAINLIRSLNIREEIEALLSQYGFIVSVGIVAVIVPFYEEIIFRGIILTSSEKQLGFKWANILQAGLFALIHFNLKLFIFYFLFGLITGYAVKRTNGLLTGIVFHAANNFIALLAIYALSKFSML
jgi:membrane protease YdiL (CAAX protease family)